MRLRDLGAALEADLRIGTPHGELLLHDVPGGLVVDISGTAAAHDLMRLVGRHWRQELETLAEHFRDLGLVVKVRMSGEQVARMGEGIRADFFSRVAGMPAIDVDLPHLLKAVLREF